MAIEKRHVRGVSKVTVGIAEDGSTIDHVHEFHDFVPVEILDAYLVDARTRWQAVEVVSDEHDPGPGGDEGLTHFPHHLSAGHPHQGKTVDSSGNYVEV